MTGYTVERTSPEVLTLRHTDVCAGWEQRYLLISDVHFDSPHCDRRLLTKLLKQAQEYGAGVLCIGDLFDAMQGKTDRRASKDGLRAEDKQSAYINTMVRNAASYLEDYLDVLVLLASGNHETAPLRHLEVDILDLLGDKLEGVQIGGYSGFVRFMFKGLGRGSTTRRYYWNHGFGGGGVVTKGAIGNNRRATYVTADIFHTGHVHEAMTQEYVRIDVNDAGRVVFKIEHHIITPGFKQEYDLRGGFAVERGMPPKPLGGYWLVFYYDGSQPGNVGYRFERAN